MRGTTGGIGAALSQTTAMIHILPDADLRKNAGELPWEAKFFEFIE
jgi:hypothetical protein